MKRVSFAMLFVLLASCASLTREAVQDELTGHAMRIRIIACSSVDPAVEVAGAYVNNGPQKMRDTLSKHIDSGVCSVGRFRVLFGHRVRTLEGVHAVVKIYEGAIDGVPMFMPVEEIIPEEPPPKPVPATDDPGVNCDPETIFTCV